VRAAPLAGEQNSGDHEGNPMTNPMTNPAPIRVLIADDHELLREELAIDLEREGLEVVAVAADGVGAVEAALRERPDVCLLDVQMPRRDGIAAAAAITAELPGTKIVMLTSSREREDALAAARAGAVGYVLKDMYIEILADVVRDVVDGGFRFPRTLAVLLATLLRQHGGTEEQPGLREHLLRLIEDGVPAREMATRLSLAPAVVQRQLGALAGELRALPAR
jgi:DNA-binding NarL/FixJ family response regulator